MLQIVTNLHQIFDARIFCKGIILNDFGLDFLAPISVWSVALKPEGVGQAIKALQSCIGQAEGVAPVKGETAS